MEWNMVEWWNGGMEYGGTPWMNFPLLDLVSRTWAIFYSYIFAMPLGMLFFFSFYLPCSLAYFSFSLIFAMLLWHAFLFCIAHVSIKNIWRGKSWNMKHFIFVDG